MVSRAAEYERRMRALGYENSLDGMDDDDIEEALTRMDGGMVKEPEPQGFVRIRPGVDRDFAARMFRRFARPFDPRWELPDLDGPGYITSTGPIVANRPREGGGAGAQEPERKADFGVAKDGDGAGWSIDPFGMFPENLLGSSSRTRAPGEGTLDWYRSNEVVAGAGGPQSGWNQTPSNMTPSGSLVGYLKAYEDFREKPYQVSPKDPPTIGYGHVILPGEDFSGGITEDEALKVFQKDLEKHAAIVTEWAEKNNVKLNQQQFDALVSFVYNVGSIGVDDETQIIADTIKKGNATPDEIRRAFGLYVRNEDGVQPGLVSRRRDEADMFLQGDYRRKE